MQYPYNWRGYSYYSRPGAETRGLSGYVETSEGPDVAQAIGDSISITAKYRKDLGDVSVRHSGIEQSTINDMRPLGFFGSLSSNEKRALILMIGGAAVWLLWKKGKL